MNGKEVCFLIIIGIFMFHQIQITKLSNDISNKVVTKGVLA
jgi:hypothetical protein